jgi:hypothetical protein
MQRCGGLTLLTGWVSIESGRQIVQVEGGEAPPERLCWGVVAAFECLGPPPTEVLTGEERG